MRLGISSYTYVWSIGVPGYPQSDEPLTPDRLLTLARELGVHVLQIADNLPLDALSAPELDAFRESARTAGVDLEIGTSGLARAKLLRWLDLAVACGSPFLRVVLDTPDHEPTPDEAVALIADLLPHFERADIVLAIENHDRFASATLREMLERIGSPHVGICFDTANSIGCLESADQVLNTLGRFIVNVHIKDYALFRPPHNKGFIVEGRPAGEGDLEIPILLKQLKGFGRDPNCIVELWPPPQESLRASMELEHRWAEESVRYLRTFIDD